MVRSKPSRGGRPLSPTAPTRLQLQQERSKTSAQSLMTPMDSGSGSASVSARNASRERRRALTVSEKQLFSTKALGSRPGRTSQDSRRSIPQQPGWIRRDESSPEIWQAA